MLRKDRQHIRVGGVVSEKAWRQKISTHGKETGCSQLGWSKRLLSECREKYYKYGRVGGNKIGEHYK